MFAKLKKKIEADGASPGKMGRAESVTSLPRVGSIQNLGPSPPCSVTSEDPAMKDVTSVNEEAARLLQRKTEQCKKLEGNISDLAALIKDKSKTIEKLEASLKDQEEVTNKKLQEQKEEFQKYRDKLIEGYQQDKLKLDQLINTEQTLTKCQSDLDLKTQQCQAAETHVERLTDELLPLKSKVAQLEVENTKLKEEVNERSELVMMLTKEKAAFDKRLDELNADMTKKLGKIAKLEEQLSDTDNEHKTYVRNSDIQHNKTSKLLQEREDHVEILQERVRTLEQRLSDQDLSGDDRTVALEAERAKLEEKLSESRQQLTEVKSTWSDKITHLEMQISNLNTKIVEDSEEFANNQRNTEQMREKFHKQIEDLRVKLDEAEKRAFENLEVSASKDNQYGKQIQVLEHEINTQKLKAMDNETQLRGKISSLERELMEFGEARQAEGNEAKSKLSKLEAEISDHLDKEIKLEAQVGGLERNISELQSKIVKKDVEAASLKQDLESLSLLPSQLVEHERIIEERLKDKEGLENHLKTSEEEKVRLLERNGELHQEMQVLKAGHAASKEELQRTIDLKSNTIDSLQKAEASLRQRLETMERQADQTEIVKAESGLYSERIEEMSATIASLQAQMTEKNRILKKQEQTLKDLRVTLQRELKVQALPNDDPTEMQNSSTNSNVSYSSNGASSTGTHGRELSSSPTPSSFLSHQQHYQHQNSQQRFSRHATSNNAQSASTSQFSTAAVVSVQSSAIGSKSGSLDANSPSVPSGSSLDALTVHTNNVKRDLDNDVNFVYLKHVVLKFMLSKEAEALQLIKAVSMLLNFSYQEQQLIKDTLEWKMSWFGHKPPLGKGQKSKIIPPTL